MSEEHLDRECLKAFKVGSKREVERLLPQLRQPANIRTTGEIKLVINGITVASGSSLLHLAAVHGWMDVVIDLITKYNCDANY